MRHAAVAALLLLAGCESDADEPAAAPERSHVVVPETPRDPPSATIRLAIPGGSLAARGVCAAGSSPVAVHDELWGEAINGGGPEAVTPHIRFRYTKDGTLRPGDI